MWIEKVIKNKSYIKLKSTKYLKKQKFSFWDWFIFLQIIGLFIFLTFYFEIFTFHKETVVYTVFACLISLQLLKKKNLFFPKHFMIPFVFFLIGVIASTLHSQVLELSVFKFLFYLTNIISFINAYSLSKKSSKNLYLYITGLFTAGFIITIYTFLKTYYPGGELNIKRTFIGPFYWHNQMAGFLLFFTPSLFLFAKIVRSKILKIMIFTSGLFLTLSLFLTYSRGGILIYVLLFIVTFYFYYAGKFKNNKNSSKKEKCLKILLPFLILISTVTILITVNPRFQKKAVDLTTDIFSSNKTTSGNLRISTYKSALHMIKDHPLLGVGMGVFGEAMYSYERKPWLYAKFTHNHFLQTFSEGGVITGISFVILIFYIYSSYIKSTKYKNKLNNNTKHTLTYALLISTATSVSHNFIDVDWNYPTLSFLFWFFNGLLIGNLKSVKENAININNSISKVLTVSILMFFILVSVILGYYDRELAGGQIALENKDYPASQKHFEKAISVLPFSYRSYWGLGYVNIELDEIEKAITNFSIASQHNPYSADPLFHKFVIEKNNSYLSEEQKEKAILEIINLNKFAQPIYYTQAYTTLKNNDKPEKAFEILELGSEERFPINNSYNDFGYIYKGQPQFSGELFDLHMTYAIELQNRGETAKSQEVAQNAITIYDNDKNFQNVIKSLRESGQ